MKNLSNVIIILLLCLASYLLGRRQVPKIPFPPGGFGTGEDSHWVFSLDPERAEAEGLVIRGSGAKTNHPLLMIRDYLDAPIAWVAPHGGLTVTDDIRVRTGVFHNDRVSMKRWTDGTELTGDGGFSWDGKKLVQTTVGGEGKAEPLPATPELWLRVIDNTGEKPRHLVIPAFLEE